MSSCGRLEPPQTLSGQLVDRHGRRSAGEFVDEPELDKLKDGFQKIVRARTFVSAQRSVDALPGRARQPFDACEKPSLLCNVHLKSSSGPLSAHGRLPPTTRVEQGQGKCQGQPSFHLKTESAIERVLHARLLSQEASGLRIRRRHLRRC